MGMSGGGGSGDFNSEINVTPMVDIMLVLLIIFMVVTPMLQHGVTVNLPKDLNNPEEDQKIVKDTSIVISIPEDGKYYIGKDEVRKDLLKERVQKMLDAIKKEEDKVVYIKSGTAVSYGDVVTVINEVRALGIDKIGLVADKKKGGGAAPAAPAPATHGA
ncbi:MAG TPA: biopolymer transporter ExbD [Pyrinomonadaceae bacterium]|nr:biopolymer transporter ExbD [Pyrinomonadaceae bacterium]